MARADTPTLLSLDRFSRVLGMEPVHFNGVFVTALDAISKCNEPLFQHGWQGQRTSREDIARAINQAEHLIGEHLGYLPAPDWTEEETHEYTRPGRAELIQTNMATPRGYFKTVRLNKALIISGGRRATTVVDLASAITYTTDPPVAGADYARVATVNAVVTGIVSEECEVRVFYPGKNADPRWEIRPIDVTITAGAAVITFNREQAVIEALLERVNIFNPDPPDIHGGIDGTVDANFLTTVDVYRVYNDPQSMAQLRWKPTVGTCDCVNDGTSCPACTHTVQVACALTHGNPRDGEMTVRPATWNATTEQFAAANMALCRDPDQARIWYRSGLVYRAGTCTSEMDPFMELAVARLAVTMLDQELCGCNHVEAAIKPWRQDMAISDTANSPQLSLRLLDNPFGTMRGAIFAWNILNQRTRPVGRAVLG